MQLPPKDDPKALPGPERSFRPGGIPPDPPPPYPKWKTILWLLFIFGMVYGWIMRGGP